MEQYISKNALVAEIKRLIKHSEMVADHNTQITELVSRELDALYHLISFLDTLEVKDAIDALRTEYEKGRADVIADTLSWLENCWPKYCSNHTIIEGFKEAIKD